MSLDRYLAERIAFIDAALDACLPKASARPATIHEAMRYCVFNGGKRLRPVLCLMAAEACDGDLDAALASACAVELIHTYSLVHDDLPAMDDDDLRRGRPTCHKVFGEGMAVLCGDALLTAAFAVIATSRETKRYRCADFVSELAYASGSKNLIGGQVRDLEGEGKELTKSQLVRIHEAKTAALLTSSLRLGAMSANATPAKLAAISGFGLGLGLAFQVIDDILDVTQSTETLGKTAGKDLSAQKATYPAILGLDAAKAEAVKLTKRADKALAPFGKRADRLRELADSMLRRSF